MADSNKIEVDWVLSSSTFHLLRTNQARWIVFWRCSKHWWDRRCLQGSNIPWDDHNYWCPEDTPYQRSGFCCIWLYGLQYLCKEELAEQRPHIVFSACFGHQMNMMAGNVLTHPVDIGITKKARSIVSFFNHCRPELWFCYISCSVQYARPILDTRLLRSDAFRKEKEVTSNHFGKRIFQWVRPYESLCASCEYGNYEF